MRTMAGSLKKAASVVVAASLVATGTYAVNTTYNPAAAVAQENAQEKGELTHDAVKVNGVFLQDEQGNEIELPDFFKAVNGTTGTKGRVNVTLDLSKFKSTDVLEFYLAANENDYSGGPFQFADVDFDASAVDNFGNEVQNILTVADGERTPQDGEVVASYIRFEGQPNIDQIKTGSITLNLRFVLKESYYSDGDDNLRTTRRAENAGEQLKYFTRINGEKAGVTKIPGKTIQWRQIVSGPANYHYRQWLETSRSDQKGIRNVDARMRVPISAPSGEAQITYVKSVTDLNKDWTLNCSAQPFEVEVVDAEYVGTGTAPDKDALLEAARTDLKYEATCSNGELTVKVSGLTGEIRPEFIVKNIGTVRVDEPKQISMAHVRATPAIGSAVPGVNAKYEIAISPARMSGLLNSKGEIISPTKVDRIVEGARHINGTGEPGQTITVELPGDKVVTTTVDENGKWQVKVPVDTILKPGDEVTVTDNIGAPVVVTVEKIDLTGNSPLSSEMVDPAKCHETTRGMSIAMGVLLPLGLLIAAGTPAIRQATEAWSAQLQQVNTNIQQQAGVYNPELARIVNEINARFKGVNDGIIRGAAALGALALAIIGFSTIHAACKPKEGDLSSELSSL